MQVVPSLIDNFDPFAMFESFFGHHRKYGGFSNFGFGGLVMMMMIHSKMDLIIINSDLEEIL